TLSLHDALPICQPHRDPGHQHPAGRGQAADRHLQPPDFRYLRQEGLSRPHGVKPLRTKPREGLFSCPGRNPAHLGTRHTARYVQSPCVLRSTMFLPRLPFSRRSLAALLALGLALSAPGQAMADSLQTQFLGVSTIQVSDGETSLLSDGFFSRPSVLRLVMPIQPNEA